MGFLESPQNTQKSQKRSAAKRLNAEFFLREKPCELPCSGSSRLCLLCFLWSQNLPSWGKERMGKGDGFCLVTPNRQFPLSIEELRKEEIEGVVHLDDLFARPNVHAPGKRLADCLCRRGQARAGRWWRRWLASRLRGFCAQNGTIFQQKGNRQ